MHFIKLTILVATFDLVVYLRLAASSNWLEHASLKTWFVERGSAIDFDCRLTNSSARVNLYRGSTILTVDGVKVAHVGQRFTLYKFGSSQDKAAYKCQSWKQNGMKKFLMMGSYRDFSTKRSPSVNVSPKAVTALEKSSVTFRCQTSSSNIKSVTWYKDMKPLPASWQNKSANGNTYTNELKVFNLDVKESGKYQCRIQLTFHYSNILKGYWPADATLTVKEFKFLTSKRQSFFVGDVGSSVDIKCETSDPNARVLLWQEDINGYLKAVVPDGTKIVKKGAQYSIHNISLKDGRKYLCKAMSIYGQGISLDVGTLVVLQGGHKNPKAYMTPTSQTLELGESFNFTCHAFGDAIGFTWLKNGKAVPASMVAAVPTRPYKGYSRFESLLVIKKAQKSMEGLYTCQITSGRQAGYSDNVRANVTIYECPKPNATFADPLDRGAYMECKNGIATRHRCPSSTQFWDDMAKQCVYPPTSPTTPFLRWLNTEDKYHVRAFRSNYTIDCRLTDPSVKVRLSKDRNQVTVDGVKVKQTGQMFTIVDLKSSDSATYVCQADGIADQTRGRLYVDQDLTHTLTITMSPSHGLLELETTHSYTIRCKSKYYGQTYWYKVDRRTHALTLVTKGTTNPHKPKRILGHVVTKSEMVLSKVTQKDSGIYMCRKNNSIGAVANATIEVVVKAPMKPSIVTDTTKEVTQYQSLNFTSKITGSPLPNVTLSKSGVTQVTCVGGQAPHCITKTRRYSGSWTRDKKSLVITVTEASYPADDGEFLLTARSVVGEEQVKVKVTINVPPVIFISKNNQLQFALSNSKHQLTCRVTASRPDPVFAWEYQQWPCDSTKHTMCKPIKNNWKPVDSRSGTITTSKGRRSIIEVPPSNSFAFYRCKAENKVGRDRVVFSLFRTDKRTDTLQIGEGEETLIADEHKNITLKCTGKFQYSGPPYWMYANNFVTNTSRIRITQKISRFVNTTYLEIFNTQVNDSGTYRCIAPKNKEINTDEVQLKVLAVSPPTVEFKSQIVNATNTVTLNCTVSGHPIPTITWQKDEKPIEVRYNLQSTSECSYRRRNAYYQLNTKSSGAGNPHTYSLVICDAGQNNSGGYQCSAVNMAGEAKESAYLDVLAPPEVKFLGANRDWEIGDEVSVKCFATGNPIPQVRWLKQRDDGIFVPVDNGSTWSQGYQYLFIEELAEDDFTNYRCEAKNKLGEDMTEFSIFKTAVEGRLTSRKPGAISRPALIAIIVSGSLVIILLLIIIAVLYRRKKLYGGFYILTLPPMPDYIKRLDPSRPIQEQTNKLPLCPEWEFPRNRLTLGKVIGTGAFGQVFKSEAVGIVAFDPRSSIKGKKARRRSRFGSSRSPYYNNKQVTTVACKGLKEDASESEYRDLVSELKILMHIGEHKNIVNLLGACTKGHECDLLVIIEFCPHGNLLEFLRKRRDLFEATWAPATEKPDETFTTTDLVITAFQVARAMEFLTTRRCVHRDLAARNVLVGVNYVMKVADFGLARDIYKDEHYVKTTSGLLPVKWMAIEALVDRIYTHQSDVWSFSVLLWEIFTLGGSPYPGLPANEVYQYLMEGQRMHQPEDCPEEIYALMLNCWEHDPNQRPGFSAIVQTIDKLLEEKAAQAEYLELENEIDFRENQPYYLQPEEIHSFQPPESPSPFNNLKSPLPPLPQEEMELQQLIRNNSVEDPNSITKDFVLQDVPKHKIKKNGSYEELDNQKKSDSSGIVSDDEDYESEKEHLMKDYDGDRVFDSPPPYINSKPYSNDFKDNYANEVHLPYKKDAGGPRGRQESARYV